MVRGGERGWRLDDAISIAEGFAEEVVIVVPLVPLVFDFPDLYTAGSSSSL